MDEDPVDASFKRLRANNKMIVSQTTLNAIDAHFNGGLAKCKKRNARALKVHKSNNDHFEILVSQLFEAYQKKTDVDALRVLERLIKCAPNNKCRQVICPACRNRKQTEATGNALQKLSAIPEAEIFMMTFLIKVVSTASELADVVANLRSKLHGGLRNNCAGLGTHLLPLKIIGAFEVDLVNLGTNYNLATKNRNLMKALGFNAKTLRSQYFVHMHALVAPLDLARRASLEKIFADALGQTQLEPSQLHFKSLHSNKTKDENIKTIARYMHKARTQFADVVENGLMEMRKKYSTPYKGNQLVGFCHAMDTIGQFKGLKFEHSARAPKPRVMKIVQRRKTKTVR